VFRVGLSYSEEEFIAILLSFNAVLVPVIAAGFV
jgi:hypothetical protein